LFLFELHIIKFFSLCTTRRMGLKLGSEIQTAVWQGNLNSLFLGDTG